MYCAGSIGCPQLLSVSVSLYECFDSRFGVFRQFRPSLDKLSQFGVFLHNLRQAGHQDISGDIRVVRPVLLLALTTRPGKVRQSVDRVGFLPSQRVRVEAHGQIDIAVPHYLLCNLRMNAGRRQK